MKTGRLLGITVLGLTMFALFSFGRLVFQEKSHAAQDEIGSIGILSYAADEIAGKLCDRSNDRLLVTKSILSMDQALKQVEVASDNRIAVAILLLVPTEGHGKNHSSVLHDDNIDFFFRKHCSEAIHRPVATVTVTVTKTSGTFESGSFVVVD